MKVLLVKMSSMGDVIHTLPAITDAMQHLPDIRFDWVIEEAFAELVEAHPAVDRVIPIAWRRWRQQLWRCWRGREWSRFKKTLQAQEYDLIIDAQGLLKSACVARLARGPRCGYDKASARESYSAYFYQRRYIVPWRQHAIERVRALFAQALGYPIPTQPPAAIPRTTAPRDDNSVLFLHGTTWPSKSWPDGHWQQLAQLVLRLGLEVKLPWSNAVEQERVQRIKAAVPGVTILPKQSLLALRQHIECARALVAVDTGLAHLGASMGVPSVSIYGPTDPELTGTLGQRQLHVQNDRHCVPCKQENCRYQRPQDLNSLCMAAVTPLKIYQQLAHYCQLKDEVCV